MLTYGIEEEFMWLSRDGRQSALPPFDVWDSPTENFSLSKETHLGVVEISSHILTSFRDVARHCSNSRAWLHAQANIHDATVFAGGTHPTLKWQNEPLVDTEYHGKTLERYGEVLKRGLVFGMHGHIGGITEEDMPRVFNTLRSYLPIFLAMSANSREFAGRDTGMECYRMTAFSSLPRTGIPDVISSAKSEIAKLNHLVNQKVLERTTELWFDARYHPVYRTIEVRNMDMQANSQLASAMLTLMFAVVEQIHRKNTVLENWKAPTSLINENRWIAMRDGKNACLFNDQYEQVEMSTIMHTLIAKTKKRLPEAALQTLCEHFNVNVEETTVV
ncbi:carboxylate-amine ligase [Glaciecola petra]|uniref:YbdK family carboxylate-amine ligase n=1 Tax=Glaciecola petra TaxID=3075602 RepID=A0ABU2ZR66_9ALTE|nr:YbdK family carboxylate-amine ligase [Aestuariibacter sp. P117]MDT0595124.1 YbdK family carboxylate-amine ligase [Aestuariibacter sp. P117]